MTQFGGRPPALFHLSLILLALCVTWPALADDLAWPERAERVMAQASASTGFDIATGPHDGAALAIVTVQGELSEEVWQIPGDAGDPARMVALIRDQLRAQGYDIGFACADRACGGFDFRYALPIAEEPIMHVDLGQFQYLTATRDAGGAMEHLALTLSQGGGLGYAHLARVTPQATPVARPIPPAPQMAGADQGVIAEMIATGAAVLTDVSFGTGASSLSDDRVESLAALAAYLADNPAQRVVLVGHTDTEGTLEANITLSRARAAAVRRYLIDIHGTNPDQVEADGIGYLSPRASNADAQGRETNRRVEAVLITD
jgi:OOP family OmpA-OmpF porin